jgi:hypothetical protein
MTLSRRPTLGLRFLVLCIALGSTSAMAAGSAAVKCAREARVEGYEWRNAALLCSGATSSAPVTCARDARLEGFDWRAAAILCSGATSRGPVTCAREARLEGADWRSAAILCGKPVADDY